MTFERMIYEPAGDVVTVTINRPRALNALDRETLRELARAVREVRRAGARVLVLTGAGDRVFVSGADIAAMAAMDAPAGRDFSRLGHGVLRLLEELPIPVIAAVNGHAFGGGLELALACDLIVASDRALLGQPEVGLGIIPGFGGTQRIARRVGIGRARELVLLGERIDAARALAIGLVDRVVPHGELRGAVSGLASTLAKRSAAALAQAKAALRMAEEAGLTAGCAYEAEAFGVAFAHPDRAEGLRAFLEKREAKFGQGASSGEGDGL